MSVHEDLFDYKVKIGKATGYDYVKNINLTPPDTEPNNIYIVSYITAAALKGTRNDVFVVNDTVRGKNGVIIGFTSFGKV